MRLQTNKIFYTLFFMKIFTYCIYTHTILTCYSFNCVTHTHIYAESDAIKRRTNMNDKTYNVLCILL